MVAAARRRSTHGGSGGDPEQSLSGEAALILHGDEFNPVAGGEDEAFADAGVRARGNEWRRRGGRQGMARRSRMSTGAVLWFTPRKTNVEVPAVELVNWLSLMASLNLWTFENWLDDPDGEDDQEDEARKIDRAAAAKTAHAADVNHRNVSEPHGEGEQDLGVAEVRGVRRLICSQEGCR